MTSIMPPIEEADEPDPLAAAEEGSGIGAYFKKGKSKARDDLVKGIIRLQEELKTQKARLAEETRPEIKALIRANIESIEGGIRDFMGMMAGGGAKLGSGVSFSRQAKVAPTDDTQRQTAPDDDGRAAAEDAQDEMIGIPATFDDTASTTGSVSTTGSLSSFDSYEDNLRHQGIYFLGR